MCIIPMSESELLTEHFRQYRALLFSIAYRMLGSATEAEDMVQESFVRCLEARDEVVQSPKAYLCAIVVRLCIDQLRSARVQREQYVGMWLPEPLATAQQPELVETPLLRESLSYAFLVLLERLGPLERAVFLLREVFEYEYAEIAAIVEKREAYCRQVLHRAHLHLEQRCPRFAVSREQQEQLTTQFLRASVAGEMQALLALLAEDIVLFSDGGGKARAGLKPVNGATKVTRGLLGGLRALAGEVQGRIQEINGQPALVGYVHDQPYGVLLFDWDGARVKQIYLVVNPDKLHWLN